MTHDSGDPILVALIALTLFNLLNLLVSFGLLRRILEIENDLEHNDHHEGDRGESRPEA